MVTPDDLGRATKRLAAHPADYSAWLEVAALLGALGSPEDAELAFATVGEGARVTGRVALAVACGRHLAERGSVRGPELVDQVVETYATGGPHFAFTAPPAPDEPPSVTVPAGATTSFGAIGGSSRPRVVLLFESVVATWITTYALTATTAQNHHFL